MQKYHAEQWTLDGWLLAVSFLPEDSDGLPVYVRVRHATKQSLHDVSISLSDMSPCPAEDMVPASQLREWLDRLTIERVALEGE